MALRIITPAPDLWDSFAESHGGHLLQSASWGAQKRAFGWQDEIVALERDGEIVAGALVLFRRLPLNLASIAYVPRGPVVDWGDEEAASALVAALDAAARRRRAIHLKIEPDVFVDSTPARLLDLGFQPSPQTVQPPRTILIDLSGPPADAEAADDPVLIAMSQSTRRKVRVAFRKEVTVREGGPEAVESFNRMMHITGERNDFGTHSPAYYQSLYDLFVPHHGALLMASYQGTDLAGIFVLAFGGVAIYLAGASSNEERSRMPAYALQWAAINWARARGCHVYDMWGIPDADEDTLEAQFQQRSDGLWGVYGFKRGFGGRVARYVGAWDRVYSPLLYRAYNFLLSRRAVEG